MLIPILTYNVALHCVCFVIESLKAFLFCSLLLSLEVQKVRHAALSSGALHRKMCPIAFKVLSVFEESQEKVSIT